MPTRDAKLLPPIPDDLGSDKSLDSVGSFAVLGAMVEQKKRASRPPPEEIQGVIDSDDTDAPKQKVPRRSDAFLKVR
jgi:hypothetical protein